MGYGVFEAKSLHYISHNAYLFRQSNLEHMQQYLLGSGWFRDASSTDFLSASRVHNNVYYFDLCYLVKDLSGLVTQMGPLARHPDGPACRVDRRFSKQQTQGNRRGYGLEHALSSDARLGEASDRP